jgi:predicted RNase H-like HicB family nuclease
MVREHAKLLEPPLLVGRVTLPLSAVPLKLKRQPAVVVERDESGYYVASVPQLRGCHTQAKDLSTLRQRSQEVIELCLDDEDE